MPHQNLQQQQTAALRCLHPSLQEQADWMSLQCVMHALLERWFFCSAVPLGHTCSSTGVF
jgi:hypothetical protein